MRTHPDLASLIADRQRAVVRLEKVRAQLLPLLIEQGELTSEIKTHDKYLAKVPSLLRDTPSEPYGKLVDDIVKFVRDAGTGGVSQRVVHKKFGASARTTIGRLRKDGVLLRDDKGVLTAPGQQSISS